MTDPSKFIPQSRDLGTNRGARRLVVRIVTGLNRKVTHALQNRLHLIERTFSGLDNADAILSVASSNREATNLRLQALGNCEACCVIRCAVDAKTTGKLLQRLRQVVLRRRQVAIGVVGHDVGVYLHTHDEFLRDWV